MKNIQKAAVVSCLILFFTTNLFSSNSNVASGGNKVVITGQYKVLLNGESVVIPQSHNNAFYHRQVDGSKFSVVIDDMPKGSYTVNIYLAERMVREAGKRIFNIAVNTTIVADSLDVFSKVGADKELIVSEKVNFTPTEDNKKFEITFTAITGDATFNAIEIVDENGALVSTMIASDLAYAANKNGNPFIRHLFTADPSAHVFNGKMVVYPSHDRDDAKGFNMTDYHVFSSSDLLTWEDHGVALDIKNVTWAKEFMWAPDCVFKDGIYYFYFPVRDKEGEFRIGVATGTSPTGPFVAEPEPIKGSFSVDPAVFIDSDGTAYMYFGGDGMGGRKNPWVAKMSKDMKSFDGEPKELTGVDYWFEACWMNKIGNTYYLSYSTGGKHPQVKGGSGLAYATSDSPTGPFIYKGLVNSRVSGWTNHHSIVEWKGQTYLFYHTSDLSGGKTSKRCLTADYIHITDDGNLHEIFQTKMGIGRYDGLAKIEAENYSEASGIVKKGDRKSDFFIAFDNNDFIVLNNVDFGNETVKKIELNFASQAEKGIIEIRDKTNKGKLIAKIVLNKTGDLNKWVTTTSNIKELNGLKNLLITYKGKKNSVVHLNWIQFVL